MEKDTEMLEVIEWKIICYGNMKKKPGINVLISANTITHDKVGT